MGAHRAPEGLNGTNQIRNHITSFALSCTLLFPWSRSSRSSGTAPPVRTVNALLSGGPIPPRDFECHVLDRLENQVRIEIRPVEAEAREPQ
jgi:hypothetical protein